MRTIDADDFGNRMYHEVFEKDTDMQKWDSGCWVRYKLFENVLREQPTIEPERKKGHWIKGKMWSEGIGMGETYGFYYACSECNSSVQGGYDVCGKNFCEKCGADNREDGSANADVES